MYALSWPPFYSNWTGSLFFKSPFLFRAVVAHTGEKLQRIRCSFFLAPSLKLTKACTKETGNCRTCVFCLICFLSPTVSIPQTHHWVYTCLCPCHLFGSKKESNTTGYGVKNNLQSQFPDTHAIGFYYMWTYACIQVTTRNLRKCFTSQNEMKCQFHFVCNFSTHPLPTLLVWTLCCLQNSLTS